jgi:hypothetical protein
MTTEAPVPAGIRQLITKQVWDVVVTWHYVQNTLRLRWGRENGMTLEDMSVSPTGLITFPGLPDTTIFPEEAPVCEAREVGPAESA